MKRQVNTYIDAFIHEKARLQNLNISAILENALKLRLSPTKKHVPDEYLKLKCSKCGAIVDYGYLCEETNKFYCKKCNLKCPLFRKNNHHHIRIPDFEGNITEKQKKSLKTYKNAK